MQTATITSYKAITNSAKLGFDNHWVMMKQTPLQLDGARSLYNGNIAILYNDHKGVLGNPERPDKLSAYAYQYDQLHRIRLARNFSIEAPYYTRNSRKYSVDYAYDPDGNLTTLNRSGNIGAAQLADMDMLTYTYGNAAKPNQLTRVVDAVSAGAYAQDIDLTHNYAYDQIGNLVTEFATGQPTATITWDVYNKVKKVTKGTGDDGTAFKYDALGNRVSKTTDQESTYYVRDAQGNVLSIYTTTGRGESITQDEAMIYGSSRIGMQRMQRSPGVASPSSERSALRQHTATHYELSNHLGNVLTTVTGRRMGVGTGATVDYYKAEVVQASDYYPFGSEIPGRTYRNPTYAGTNAYRYGFNAKELDKSGEFGSLTHYDYGFRIYNPSIGRFLSVDPLTKSYPWYTPYQFAGNKPIIAIDRDGAEEEFKFNAYYAAEQASKPEIAKSDRSTVYRQVLESQKIFGAANPKDVALGVGLGIGVGIAVYGGVIAWPFIEPIAYRGLSWMALNQQSIAAVGGLAAGALDPNPSHDYPGNFDDLARGTRLLISSTSHKYIFNTSKFEFVLNTLTTKSKNIAELTQKEIANLAKSNLRVEYFGKIGIKAKDDVVKFISEAMDNGTHIESIGEYGVNVTKQVTKEVDGVSTKFNVNFIKRKGEELLEFTGISVPDANKNIAKEVSRLKSN